MKQIVHVEDEFTFTGTTTARAPGDIVLIGSVGTGSVCVLMNGTGGATAADKKEVAAKRNVTIKDQAKQTNAAFVKGNRIFWNNTTRKFTTVSTTGTRAGKAYAAATTASATGSVRLVEGN